MEVSQFDKAQLSGLTVRFSYVRLGVEQILRSVISNPGESHATGWAGFYLKVHCVVLLEELLKKMQYNIHN